MLAASRKTDADVGPRNYGSLPLEVTILMPTPTPTPLHTWCWNIQVASIGWLVTSAPHLWHICIIYIPSSYH